MSEVKDRQWRESYPKESTAGWCFMNARSSIYLRNWNKIGRLYHRELAESFLLGLKAWSEERTYRTLSLRSIVLRQFLSGMWPDYNSILLRCLWLLWALGGQRDDKCGSKLICIVELLLVAFSQKFEAPLCVPDMKISNRWNYSLAQLSWPRSAYPSPVFSVCIQSGCSGSLQE